MKRLFPFFLIVLLILGGCSGKSKANTESAHQNDQSPSAGTEGESDSETPPSTEGESGSPSSSDMSRAEEFSRALAKKNQVYDPAKSVLNLTDTSLAVSSKKQYTIMVYMIGSDLESMGGAATSDLIEMDESGIDLDANNLLVYTGGSRRWFADIPCDYNCLLDMSRSEEDRIVAQTDGNADMGAPLTLSNFINLCTEYYPADHYMLIFWDHGGGPIMGYGCDELFSKDSLLLSELKEAMDTTIFANDQKLDLVGFDACLMGGLENMSVWSDYADYYIGSEELEPGDGWNYAFLSTLNETADPVEIGSDVIDQYQSYYEAKMSDVYHPDLTLSMIDLSKVGDAINSLSSMALEMTENLSGTQFNSIQRLRDDVKSFGYVAGKDESDATYFDLADLYHLAEIFSETYPESTLEIQDAVDEMVVKAYATIDHAHGVSLYFPLKNKWMYTGSEDILESNSFSDDYTRFLNQYGTRWTTSESHAWSIPGIESATEEGLAIQLTDEQLANAASYYLTIFRSNSLFYGELTPFLTNYKLEPDADGRIVVPEDPEVLVLSPSEEDYEDYTLWPASIVEQTEERTVYHLDRTRVTSSLDMNIGFGEVEMQEIDMTVASEPGSDDVQILSASAASGIDSFGKNTVDITGWEVLTHVWNGLEPTYDASGHVLHYSQWNSDSGGFSFFSIDDGFVVKKKHLSDMTGTFYMQVTVVDANGDRFGSELITLEEKTPEVVDVASDDGTMTFTLTDEYAYLSGYYGSDTELDIPEIVNNLPVLGIGTIDTYNDTVTSIQLPDTIQSIGFNAFSDFEELSSINLPEGLLKIDSYAFAYTKIKTLDLPFSLLLTGKSAFGHMEELTQVDFKDSLKIMCSGPFMDCPMLEQITINGESSGSCEAFKLVDGVLFSADQKTLLAYPGARTGSYTVPDGTETIGYCAFHSTSVSEVILPETVSVLGHFSFFKCLELTPPDLPDSLTEIRSFAFGTEWFSIQPSSSSQEKKTIRISSDVRTIGSNAFDLYSARQFEVDSDNPYYSSLDGALMNARGDALLQCASDGTGVFVIPEGTKSFEWDQLDYLNIFEGDYLYLDSFEVVIPSSVTNMPSDDYSLIDRLHIHCPHGSAAEAYAIEHEIPYDDMMDLNFTLHEETIEDGTAVYRIYKDHAVLQHMDASVESFTIPETVEGVPVTIIGNGTDDLLYDSEDPYAFHIGPGTLVSLTMPDTVTEINATALYCYHSLEDITFSKNLTSLGDQALPTAFKLKAIPESIKYLGRRFAYSDVESITIPAGVVSVSDEAFADFTNLKSIEVDPQNENYTVQDGVLFTKDLKKLVCAPKIGTTYTIPEGTEQLAKFAFLNAREELEEVTLPASITTIGKYAFYGCSNLKKVNFAEGLVEIDYDAFYQCESLTSLSFPSTLRSIGGNAFSGCTSLSTVTFNEGLASIGSNAFDDTPLLTDVKLPESLISLDFRVFGEPGEDHSLKGSPTTMHLGPNLTEYWGNALIALNITAFEVDPANPAYATLDGFLTDKTKTALIAAPPGLTGSVHIPDGITILDIDCLDGLILATDLYIPASVEDISSQSIPYDYVDGERIYQLTIHCAKGSEAEQFAQQFDIPYVTE